MNILITGAGRGIGFEVVKKFATDPENKILALSRDTSQLDLLIKQKKQMGIAAEVIPFSFDFTRFDNYNDLNQFISEHVKHIDIMLLNAGTLAKASFSELSLADANRVFNVNFFSVFLTIRNLIPFLGVNTPSHVVTISSMAGFQGSSKFAGLSLYGASKAAVISLTESLAIEYKGSGIFFNSLALGAVDTEMLQAAFPGITAPLTASQMAEFISDFCKNGYKYFNGKVLPVALANP